MKISETEMPVTTIVLADGARHVLDALRLLLEEQGDFAITGEAQSAEVLLTQVGKAAPEVILLDWNLPGTKAFDHQRLVRVLRQRCPNTKLAVMSVRPEDERIVRDYCLDGFISKQLAPDMFLASLKAIRTAKN